MVNLTTGTCGVSDRRPTKGQRPLQGGLVIGCEKYRKTVELIPIPEIGGECPTMHRATRGTVRVLADFKEASDYVATARQPSAEILVTQEVDWSWTHILERFSGVITDHGTRVSRAAEVLVIMGKPGVLGVKRATQMLESGTEVQIVCNGNKASIYFVGV
jgi:phosphoenolpyruvate synthase/pyruvate phosphate dikinase